MVDWFRLGYAVAYVAFAVGAASSVARFYSRGLVVRLWGWDDSAACVVFVGLRMGFGVEMCEVC